MGRAELVTDAVIIYFNQRTRPVNVSPPSPPPPFHDLLLVVATGVLCVHGLAPQRGSKPQDNAEWLRINIAALVLVLYSAVCTIFAVGPAAFCVVVFFKKHVILKMQCSKCS